jgi:xanthine dehydrogenase YagT iron-sulfur-binding subunit
MKTSDNHLEFSRRSFLSSLGITTAAVIPAEAANERVNDASPAVILRVNGTEHNLRLDPRTTLLDCLRETLHLTGTKKGCDHGQCGACTVHINGRRVVSCLTFASMHHRDEITTVEGLGQPGKLHPVQAAFVEHDAYQCGACTSGQIMSAAAVLNEPWGPSDQDAKEAMAGNICRCGAYPNIIAAVQHLRRQNGNKLWTHSD